MIGNELEGRMAVGVGVAALVIALAFPTTALSDGGNLWIGPAVLTVAALLSWGIPRIVTVSAPGATGLALFGALLGIGASAPETGAVPFAALMIALPVALELGFRRHVQLIWYLAAVGTAAWAGLAGSNLRPSAVVAALFAWWAVLLIPIVDRITPYSSRVQPLAVTAAGAAAVIAMARTGGIADTRNDALLAATLAAAVSLPAALGASALCRGFSHPSAASEKARD